MGASSMTPSVTHGVAHGDAPHPRAGSPANTPGGRSLEVLFALHRQHHSPDRGIALPTRSAVIRLSFAIAGEVDGGGEHRLQLLLSGGQVHAPTSTGSGNA